MFLNVFKQKLPGTVNSNVLLNFNLSEYLLLHSYYFYNVGFYKLLIFFCYCESILGNYVLTFIALTLCIHRCKSVMTWLKSNFLRDKVNVNGNFIFPLEKST